MAKRILVLPDINYEPGHWRPVMAMMKKLLNLNEEGSELYQIKFLCTPECEPIIKNYNPDWDTEIIFPELYDVGYTSLIFEKPEEGHSKINHCLRIAEGSINKTDGSLDNLVNEYNPDLLIAGFFVSAEALLIYHRYNIPFIIVTTFLRHPNETPAITSLRFLVFHDQEISSRLMNSATRSNSYNGSLTSIKEFTEPLNDITELVTCPKELDHPEYYDSENAHREKTIYVEPSILIEPSDYVPDDTFLYKTYSSAGSRVMDYVESAKTLFLKMKEMIRRAECKNRKIQLAVGYKLKSQFKEFENNERMEIVQWANQTAMLEHATSAVIHGGLATIKECVFFGVPHVIVPFGKDQMDNALRVVNQNAGALVLLDNLTEEKLSKAIIDAENNPDLKENLQKLQKIFVDEENEPKSIQIIQDVLNGS
ncbi:MAG TPA: glycosyltransferase [Chitinispirillaceae bacterium]|jgi:UDP:flavonoid glycosyltransferase YjiC (YdhE family)|nr:glycosyltransferase [Chitinispirillaceae bacterium]